MYPTPSKAGSGDGGVFPDVAGRPLMRRAASDHPSTARIRSIGRIRAIGVVFTVDDLLLHVSQTNSRLFGFSGLSSNLSPFRPAECRRRITQLTQTGFSTPLCVIYGHRY